MASPQTLRKLAAYDTPTICNVIEIFEVRPRNEGFMGASICAAFPELPPMVGFAATAKFASGQPPTGGDAYLTAEDQLKQLESLPGPAVVVFEDIDNPPVGATFGEVMCSGYQAFQSVGLVTSGAGRDLEQVRALEYPVFTGSTICSHAYCQIMNVGDDVVVGGLKVKTGDLLHGDANGVTNIPLDIASEVADACEDFIAAEALAIDYAKSSTPKSAAQYVELRREMGAAIGRLRDRVSRQA